MATLYNNMILWKLWRADVRGLVPLLKWCIAEEGKKYNDDVTVRLFLAKKSSCEQLEY